jgi:hypothetical protein
MIKSSPLHLPLLKLRSMLSVAVWSLISGHSLALAGVSFGGLCFGDEPQCSYNNPKSGFARNGHRIAHGGRNRLRTDGLGEIVSARVTTLEAVVSGRA